MKKLGKYITLIAVALTLSACGGGGGGGAVKNTTDSTTSPVTFTSSFDSYVSDVNAYVSNLSALQTASTSDINNARSFISNFNSLKTFWDQKHNEATTAQKLAWFYDADYVNARKIFHWLESEVLPLARDFADDGKFTDTNYNTVQEKINNGTHLDSYNQTVEDNRTTLCSTQTVYRCNDTLETYITSYSDTSASSDTVVTGTATTTSELTSTEDRVSTDASGNTVTKTYALYTDTTTTPVTTTTTVIVTRTNTWSDDSTTTEVISTTSSDSTTNTVTTSNREVLTNTDVVANIMSSTDSESSETSSTNGTATTVTEATSTRNVESTDSAGNTITTTYTTYTDTTTTPVTTTVVTTTTRTYTWSNGETTNEVIDTATTQTTSNTVSASTREVATNIASVANIVSYSDSNVSTDTTSTGTATVTTEATSTRQTTETDDSGNTVVKTYTTYTDTTTTPVTTTTTVVTTRTYTWSDGSTTSEVINTASTDSVENTVTTATREVLTDTATTANKMSYSDSESASTTTTVSEPVLTSTVTNTDTRDDGVWTYYYRTYTTTTTVTTTTTTTRTWTWSDGSTTTETLDPTVETTVTTSDEVITEIVAPDSDTTGGDEPTDNSGSSTVTQDGAPTLDYDPATYDASTYYNSAYLGTPTNVSSHDPADYSIVEFDNNANSEVNANYAYARGWTGEGSTALIMDTGIDQDHTEFTDKIKYTWDAGFDTPIEDENGHGTHVAGIVAASKDGVGTHGVAYNAKLAIAKIGEARGISLSAARQSLNWAKQYDDIVVANLSANTNYSSSYLDAMTDQGNGIFTNNHSIYGGSNYYNLEDPQAWADVLPDELVLVMSAGNQSLDYVQNPAVFASATNDNGSLVLDGRLLVVGNWNTGTNAIDGGKAGHVCKDYTNGTCNDTYKTSDFYILAPGTAVTSTYNDGGYKSMSGTSMAAPVVTGGVAIVHQMWPYMQGSNIAQLLLQTADKTISGYDVTTHGQGLMDLDQATRPVGDLGISLTGRTGTTATISGSLSVDGVDDAVVSSVSAVDDFDRDFNVDLSSMVSDNETSLEQVKHKSGQSWGVKYANINTQNYNNFTLGTDNEGVYALGYTHNVNKNLDLGITYSNSNESPWINMSGVWGEVDGSKTIDANITWTNDQLWAQAGVMNTKTDIDSGLVTNVSDVRSVYAVAGTTYNEFDLYAGIKPKVVSGGIDLNIPTSVDANGIMHYNATKQNLSNETTPFIGVSRKFYLKEENNEDMLLHTDMIADGAGNHSVGFTFEFKF